MKNFYFINLLYLLKSLRWKRKYDNNTINSHLYKKFTMFINLKIKF